MRIIEIVASVADEAAGPSYSVPRLAEAVARAGAQVDLFALNPNRDNIAVDVGCRTFSQSLARVPLANELRLSSAMRSALHKEALHADVLHTHGLWLMPNIYPARAARANGKVFVLSPRGMLGAPALQFSRLRKRVFWLLLQERATRSATLLHATSHAEYEDIRRAGVRGPVAVIPNGIDVPPLASPVRGPSRVVLSLGRIHPKKGLDRLVQAWAHLGTRTGGWRLKIVGPDEDGHADELRKLAASLNLTSVDFESPLFGKEKFTAYRQATLFVLPTLNENFAMTVAESLATGTPAIVTKGAPWAGLEAEKCGWWVDHGVEPLAAALADALARPPEVLRAMGVRGRDWMLRDYSWDRVGREMLKAYRWAAAGGPRPANVLL
jgi:glycosyltransferase involved in cell wall biosynthesis